MPPSPVPRVLVIKSRNIGDVLLAAPLISALGRHVPQGTVDALVKAGTEAMLEGHPQLGRLDCFPQRAGGEGRRAFVARQFGLLRRLRQRGYTLVLNTTEGERGALWGLASGAPERAGLHNRHKGALWHRLFYSRVVMPPPGRRHTVLRNLDLLPPGVAPCRRVELRLAPAHARRVDALLAEAGWSPGQPLVQVHPCSRWSFKCWDNGAMAAVVDHIQSRGATVVLTCAPDAGERARLEAIRGLCRSRPLDLGGRLGLGELAALSARCRFFLGVDTAPMHMAAALDVPVLALFGPSGAFDWGPWPNDWAGEGTPWPATAGVQRAGPHTVIQQDWPCVPCGRDGCDGSKRSRCLDELPVARVLPELERFLAGMHRPWPVAGVVGG